MLIIIYKMKTIKDKNYSFNHVKRRLKKRHDIDITIEEYDWLCYSVKNIEDKPIHIEKQKGDIQKVYDIMYGNKIIRVVWSETRQLVTTALVP